MILQIRAQHAADMHQPHPYGACIHTRCCSRLLRDAARWTTNKKESNAALRTAGHIDAQLRGVLPGRRCSRAKGIKRFWLCALWLGLDHTCAPADSREHDSTPAPGQEQPSSTGSSKSQWQYPAAKPAIMQQSCAPPASAQPHVRTPPKRGARERCGPWTSANHDQTASATGPATVEDFGTKQAAARLLKQQVKGALPTLMSPAAERPHGRLLRLPCDGSGLPQAMPGRLSISSEVEVQPWHQYQCRRSNLQLHCTAVSRI
jgi:hypothetical protein